MGVWNQPLNHHPCAKEVGTRNTAGWHLLSFLPVLRWHNPRIYFGLPRGFPCPTQSVGAMVGLVVPQSQGSLSHLCCRVTWHLPAA